MKSDTLEDKLITFHTAFNHPVNIRYPNKYIIDKQRTLRKTLIDEEYREVIDSIENGTPDEILKELCDLVYVCIGFAATYGWSFSTAFNRVHSSNMSKLDDSGKPIYREDGKVAKSRRYIPPKLKDLI